MTAPHAAAAPIVPRKGAQRSDDSGPLCFCRAYKRDCKCRVFQPRPCGVKGCGHAYGSHMGRCSELGCKCRGYRESQAPEFLLRMGIRDGEWSFATVAQLEALMRPARSRTAADRVAACLMLLSSNQAGKSDVEDYEKGKNRGRLVVVPAAGGKGVRPAQPSDIVERLNALDTIGRLDKRTIGREIRIVEQWGFCRQVGKTRKNIRLFVYAKPLNRRDLPDLVITSDDQISASPTNETSWENLSRNCLSHISRTVGKQITGMVRAAAETIPDLVITSDDQKRLDELVENHNLAISSDVQTFLEVIRCRAIYKEDSSSSSTSSSKRGPQLVPEAPAPTVEATTTKAIKRSSFCTELLQIFLHAGKPAPTDAQMSAVEAAIPEDGGAEYLNQMRGKIGRIRHPGALATDAATFAKAWEADAPRRQQLAAAASAEADHFDEITDQFTAEQRAILADPNADAEDKLAADWFLNGTGLSYDEFCDRKKKGARA